MSTTGSPCDVPTLNLIADNVEWQIKNGLRSKILVPDWDGFKKYMEKTDYYLLDSVESSRRRYTFSIDGEIEFDVGQTLLSLQYEEGSPTAGFGFKNFECLECGCEDLLYDEKEDLRYCPIHG